jgi:hypothetical protein
MTCGLRSSPRKSWAGGGIPDSWTRRNQAHFLRVLRWENRSARVRRSAPPPHEPCFRQSASDTSTGATCGDAIVAASPQISPPSLGWFGVAGKQFHAGCWVEWRKGHGRIARSGMDRHKTRRCAVGLKRRERNDALSLGKKRCAVGSHLLMGLLRFFPGSWRPFLPLSLA